MEMYSLTWIGIVMQNEARRMQTSQYKHTKGEHTLSELRRCRGLGVKVAPKVLQPLIFKS